MFRQQPRRKPRQSALKSIPAARDGWIANQALAQPNARKLDGSPLLGASVLDSMFPSATGNILLRGSETYATLGAGTSPVRALFAYNANGIVQMFGANDTTIYNITSVDSPINLLIGAGNGDVIGTEDDDILGISSTEGLDVVTGQTGGFWITEQFATAGGIFLRMVNGQDTPLVYDGADFDTFPALTFKDSPPGITPSMLSYVWAYKNRLWFIQKDTMDVWYLPVDQVGGELVKLPLGGIFPLGGALMFGASWSLDGGQLGGLSEQMIVVSTEGEVAVFQGTSPDQASTWDKVGVYRIGRPLGNRAWMRDGGDLIISTSIGHVRLSQAVQRDPAALGPTAVSYPIETAWNAAVQRSPEAWHCAVWPSKAMAVISLPSVPDMPSEMYIANIRTGAWCRRPNWDGTCLLVFKERLFFGTPRGTVVEANVSGLDEGRPYTGVCVPLFNDLKSPASLKVTELVRAVCLSPYSAGIQVSMHSDFVVNLPPSPDALPVPVGNEWGNAIWGQSVWGTPSEAKPIQDWVTAPGYGYTLAPAIQVTSGALTPIDLELVRFEFMFTVADVVT